MRARELALFLSLTIAPGTAVGQEMGGFELSGGVYLYHFAPIDVDGVGDKTEVYALFVNVDQEHGRWAFHGQARLRDTRLRPFFPSNVWVQEVWVAYRLPEPLVTLRAGKIYQRLGRFWDASFFGNLHYFDGLKLDPEFGAEAEAVVPIGDVALAVTGQYLAQSDRVNGSLEGRDIEGFDDSREEDGFTLGIRLTAPPIPLAGRPLALVGGISALREGAEWTLAPGEDAVDVKLHHLALELESRWGPLIGYAEWMRRSTDDVPSTARASVPGSRATYWLLGAQAHLGPLRLRYNYSRADYDDAGFTERIHQPGVGVNLSEGIHTILEYDDWRRDLDEGGATRIDRSLNFVILVEF